MFYIRRRIPHVTRTYVSDFISDTPFHRELSILARRHKVSCFLIHDPLEQRLPGLGLIEVEDAETGRRRLVDASAMRAEVDVESRVREIRRTGAHVTAITTAEDPFIHLLRHFRRLEHLR